MTWRVLRWTVAVDDRPHRIGGGPVLHTANRTDPYRPYSVTGRMEVWTLENCPRGWPQVEPEQPKRTVQVFGTGQALPEGIAQHLGSVLDGENGELVWHLFSVRANL